MNFTYRKDEVDYGILKLIERELIRPNSPIEFDLSVEGQTSRENKYYIGPWAGPQADISNLLHEASHFAEREIDKLLLFPHGSWGFSFGKYWQIGTHSGYETNTTQSILREQRVWAYQLSNMQHFGVDVDPFELLSSVTYLNAWCYYESGGEQDDRIKKLTDEAVIMSQNEYTYEAFIEAWRERVERLQNVTGIEGEVSI